MKLEIHNGLRDPQVVEASRVVVKDMYDNPVAVAIEVDEGIIIAETASNKAEFYALLRNLGITKTLVVHDAQQKPLAEITENNSAF